MLVVAMALFTSGCNDKKKETPVTQEVASEESVETVEAESSNEEGQTEEANTQSEETAESEVTVLGEGETTFLFTVVDKEGSETVFEIHTEKEIVGEALQELELIEGEVGEFGLFVKTVNGIVTDYDVDKTYWAFYINGEYAMSGVDTTAIEEGNSYMFKVEK